MEKFRTALNKALELLAGLSMAVMVILTTYQVIARYIFNSPSTWSEELVGYLFGWSTLFGATIVSGERGHMNIPILVDRMNPGMRKAFHILWEVVAFLFSATILVFGGLPGPPNWPWASRPPRWAWLWAHSTGSCPSAAWSSCCIPS